MNQTAPSRGNSYWPRLALAAALAAAAAPATAAVPLPAYNADLAQTSISGLSSGGFMAQQLHVAYSATFKAGAGIVAGGPFYCAEGNLGNAVGRCMAASAYSKPPTASLIATTNSWAGQGAIDPTANLGNSRVYLFSGSIDSTVKPLVMDEAHVYYKNYVSAGNLFYKNNLAAEHAMVTDDYGSNCSVKGSPYINNCGFDLAGEILKWIYGPLAPRNNGSLGGSFIEFNQAEFIANPTTRGMAATGWLYVPAACASGESCRVHVVLHGCQQDPTKIGDQYYKKTGYNRWADSNRLIVLYPQTAPSSSGNPNGCWDWWGYDDPNYAKKSGRQMAAIKGMVDRLTSGVTVPPALPAPAGLAVTGVTDSSVALRWDGVAGAAGYHVYRNGNRVNGAALTATSHTDGGLAAGTGYSYALQAVNATGATGAMSAAVTATTSGTPPPLPVPTNLTVGAVGADSVTLSWGAVAGASGYNLYRDGAKVNATPLTATSYADRGLAPSTRYRYAVSALNGGGESALSAAVEAVTASGFACSTSYSSNYAHVQAGRAYQSGGYALAKGSNQNMGLNNLFYTSTLAQTAPGYYIIGNCP